MTRYQILTWAVIAILLSCTSPAVFEISQWQPYDESKMLADVADHDIQRMQLKLVQSKVSDKNDIWDAVRDDISPFSEEQYTELYDLIYERSIVEIQEEIEQGNLSYEQLTLWYLYRILKYENDSTTTLHTIIALNPDALEEARSRDKNRASHQHPIYGMPILLKDNINTAGMPTTAGAIALKDNQTEDAHIVKNLKRHGAIILGKVNLSEWAYFFCGGCPVGYSAIGGQTLNPYGRGVYETGGSSSGSGTSTSANYAVGAVGTETSGSILSPSGKNSVVGLKPTVGLLSRSGIVPISSTLDTPGPMTKSVIDNAILLSAMTGEDDGDPATKNKDRTKDYLAVMSDVTLEGKRLGVRKAFLERDTLYMMTTEYLKTLGAEIIVYEAPDVSLEGFGQLLSADMKRDLPSYIDAFAGSDVSVDSIRDVVNFNLEDSLIRAPYGQARLAGAADDTTSDEDLAALVSRIREAGKSYFDIPIDEHNLDAVLSIDNYSAGFAAAANYPCLTIPMGYRDDGAPSNLTFIAPSEQEDKLLRLGYAYEQASKKRKPPF